MKTAIFDLDGTLINSITTITYYGNKALSRFGFPTAEEKDFCYFVGNGAVRLVERALTYSGNYTKEAFDLVYPYYKTIYDEEPLYLTRPYDGVCEALTALRARGYRMAVISNKPDIATREVVKKLLPDVFDLVSGDDGRYPLKPDPTRAEAMMASLGAVKSETIFIGDTKMDVETGKNAGLYTLGVLWGFRPREELESAGADSFVASPTGLFDAVVRWEERK